MIIATSQFTISVINDGKDGQDGAKGDRGISITKTREQWFLSRSNSALTGDPGTETVDGKQIPVGTWTYTEPSAIPDGYYLWGRLENTMSEGDPQYSDAVYRSTISGLKSEVDKANLSITNKVWQTDLSTTYGIDKTTITDIRDRVTSTQTTLDGITSQVLDIETTADPTTGKVTYESKRISTVEQTADKIGWVIQNGSTSSSLTLTDKMLTAMTNQFIIKDPNGTATVISGGRIQTGSITTNMLATDAIQSNNYNSGRTGHEKEAPSGHYSVTGSFFDLSNGNIYTPNFGVINTSWQDGPAIGAYFNGRVEANSGKFGNSSSYWNIETVYDYYSQPHAALVGTGSPYLQTGNWQVSDDAVSTRKYTSSSASTGNVGYYSNGGYYYDFGMKVITPDGDSDSVDYKKSLFYLRKADTQHGVPSLDSGWTYPFRIDSDGHLYCTDLTIIGGGTLTTFLPIGGGTITGDLTVEGTLTATASKASELATTHTIITDLASTNGAAYTGKSNITPGITGTLGVGHGGTGKSSWTQWGIVYASATNTLAQIGAGTSGQVLRSNGSAAPSWTNQSALSVGSATKATQDADGNVISSTYRKLDNGVFDTIQVTDLTAGDLMVTGVGRFTNGLYGNLTGNVIGDVAGNVTGNVTGSSTKVKDSGNGTDITFAYSKSGLSSTSWFAAWNGYELRAINPANALSTLGALPLTGGTVTGSIYAKFTNIDASKSNNNVSADTYPTTFSIYDTADRILTRMEAVVHPTGNIDAYWYVKNYKTDGTKASQKGIRMSMDKTGVLTYTVDDADKFRTAISLNNVTNNKQVKGLSSGTTSGHLVTWGSDGYTVADSGIASTGVATKLTLAGTDYAVSSNAITVTRANLQSAVQDTSHVLMTNEERSKLASIQVSSGGTIDFSGVTATAPLSATVHPTNKTVNITHDTSVAAGTAQGSNGTLSNGGTFTIPTITYNEYGHITATGTTSVTLPSYNAVTTSANGLMISTDKTKLDNINIAYGTCTTAAGTAAKVVNITSTGNWSLVVGSIIAVRFSNSNTASNVTLNVNGSGAKNIWYNNALYTSTSQTVCGYANRTHYYMYDGTNWVWMSHGAEDNSNTVPTAHCTTAAGTAAKTATCSNYKLPGVDGSNVPYKSHTILLIANSNTASGALTLNINGTGVRPLYINGTASSASNCTLPAGSYLVYYDGTNYYIRTDGKITGDITGNAASASSLTDIKADRFVIGNGTSAAYASNNMSYLNNEDITVQEDSTVKRNGILIAGNTYGNNAAYLTSNTVGVLSYGDGGPQIMFGTGTATAPGSQLGSLIFTDHDSCGTGVSWHFVSNQDDWNVNSKRFVAKTSVSVGVNVPNKNYNLYVNGTTNLNGETTGTIIGGTILKASNYISANSGKSNTDGGLVLWGANTTQYSLAARATSNSGVHGYVSGDFAIYSYMSATNDEILSGRGWVLRDSLNSSNVASVSAKGHAVFNGSVTVGGNATNTSGCRQEYNSELDCLDFIFN